MYLKRKKYGVSLDLLKRFKRRLNVNSFKFKYSAFFWTFSPKKKNYKFKKKQKYKTYIKKLKIKKNYKLYLKKLIHKRKNLNKKKYYTAKYKNFKSIIKKKSQKLLFKNLFIRKNDFKPIKNKIYIKSKYKKIFNLRSIIINFDKNFFYKQKNFRIYKKIFFNKHKKKINDSYNKYLSKFFYFETFLFQDTYILNNFMYSENTFIFNKYTNLNIVFRNNTNPLYKYINRTNFLNLQITKLQKKLFLKINKFLNKNLLNKNFEYLLSLFFFWEHIYLKHDNDFYSFSFKFLNNLLNLFNKKQINLINLRAILVNLKQKFLFKYNFNDPRVHDLIIYKSNSHLNSLALGEVQILNKIYIEYQYLILLLKLVRKQTNLKLKISTTQFWLKLNKNFQKLFYYENDFNIYRIDLTKYDSVKFNIVNRLDNLQKINLNYKNYHKLNEKNLIIFYRKGYKLKKKTPTFVKKKRYKPFFKLNSRNIEIIFDNILRKYWNSKNKIIVEKQNLFFFKFIKNKFLKIFKRLYRRKYGFNNSIIFANSLNLRKLSNRTLNIYFPIKGNFLKKKNSKKEKFLKKNFLKNFLKKKGNLKKFLKKKKLSKKKSFLKKILRKKSLKKKWIKIDQYLNKRVNIKLKNIKLDADTFSKLRKYKSLKVNYNYLNEANKFSKKKTKLWYQKKLKIFNNFFKNSKLKFSVVSKVRQGQKGINKLLHFKILSNLNIYSINMFWVFSNIITQLKFLKCMVLIWLKKKNAMENRLQIVKPFLKIKPIKLFKINKFKNKITNYLTRKQQNYLKMVVFHQYKWFNVQEMYRKKLFKKKFNKWLFFKFRKIKKNKLFLKTLRSNFESLTGFSEKWLLNLWRNYRKITDTNWSTNFFYNIVKNFSKSILMLPHNFLIFLKIVPTRLGAQIITQSGGLIINGCSSTSYNFFINKGDILQINPKIWNYSLKMFKYHKWMFLRKNSINLEFLQIDWSSFMFSLIRLPYDFELNIPNFLSEQWIRFYIRQMPRKIKKYKEGKLEWKNYKKKSN